MALSHNAFIRGFNSIYQQAPRLTHHSDKLEFVGYCFAWIRCVKTHHQYEETDLFPNINKAAGQTGLMEDAVHEHEAFYGGMDRMQAYLQDQGASFSAIELIHIMDLFKDALHSHLKAEPPAIVALAKYSTLENPIDILRIAEAAGKAILQGWEGTDSNFTFALGKKQVNLDFLFNTLPVFFLNMETVHFENGMWHEVFPPLKGLARMIMMTLVPMWQSRRWRFASCSSDGTVKHLAV
jgi:hemerythrin-like domain-containing protein